MVIARSVSIGWFVNAAIATGYLPEVLFELSHAGASPYYAQYILQAAEIGMTILIEMVFGLFIVVNAESIAKWAMRRTEHLFSEPAMLLAVLIVKLIAFNSAGFGLVITIETLSTFVSMFSESSSGALSQSVMSLLGALARLLLDLATFIVLLARSEAIARWITKGLERFRVSTDPSIWPPAPREDADPNV